MVLLELVTGVWVGRATGANGAREDLARMAMSSDISAEHLSCRFANWTSRREHTRRIWHQLLAQNCTELPVLVPPPTPKCKLALIAAGMPRTGSTMTFKLLRAALTKLGLWQHNGTALKYWQWHFKTAVAADHGPLAGTPGGSECKRRWEIFHASEAQLNQLTTDQIVIVKSHEFDESLLNLCKATIVFTSTRDVAEIASSKIRSGWLPQTDGMSNSKLVSELAAGIKGDIEEHSCWRQSAPRNVNVLFSEVSNCGWYLVRIASAVAQALPLGTINLHHLNGLNHLGEFDTWCRQADMNPEMKSTSTSTLAFDDDVAAALRHKFATWQRAHGFSIGNEYVVL
jgi:hypothetical protein